MCGRVIQSSGPLRYGIVAGMDLRDTRVHNYPPRWNGAPSQDLLVIRRNHQTGQVSLDPLRWGTRSAADCLFGRGLGGPSRPKRAWAPSPRPVGGHREWVTRRAQACAAIPLHTLDSLFHLPDHSPDVERGLMDLGGWLRSLGLERYEGVFHENAIGSDVLHELTDQDLEKLGVLLGDRRRLLRAIAALNDGTSPPGAPAAPLSTSVTSTPSTSASAEVAGERRYLTVMFCDLVGSTGIAAKLDAEEWRDLVGAYLDVASAAVVEMGGHVAKKLGDGILAVFGYPVAQENDAERAARAALSIQRALADLNRRNVGSGKPELATRIGLDTGPAVVDAAGEIYGDVANVAARVQALAEPGAVLITARVQRQVAGLFVAEERGAHTLKGVPEPTALYRLVRASGGGRRAGQRHLTPLVGRDEEIALLMRRWERARQGDGQLVLIVGDPGLGKSRLIEEFHSRLADTPHTWVEWSCSQLLQNTPLHPIAEWGRQRFGASDVPAERRLADLESSLAEIKLDPAEMVPLLAPLLDIPLPIERMLGLAPEEVRRRQLAALTNWMMTGAKVQPVVLAFEDLHWADPTTLDVLRGIAERGALAPLYIVATTRPEFRPPWSMRSHHGTISLAPLDRAQVRDMVAELSARHALPNEVVEDVAARTGGVPLFVEEVTRLLLERGEQGGLQAIPPTLQQSLMARLDRLGPARELAQIGSVIGRGFSYGIVREVAGLEDAPLQAALEKLAEADIVLVQGLPPESDYRFKHALIQDAAYENLLKSRRQVLHRRVAEILLDSFADTAAAEPEVLAHHFTQAGVTGAAIEWWQKAGKRSLERSAITEAIAHFTEGIRLTQSLPAGPDRDQCELELQLSLGPALMAARGYGAAEVEGTYARAHELCRHLGTGPNRFAVLRGLWEYYEIRARTETAKQIADEMFNIAEQSGDRTLLLVAHDVIGDTSLWVPDFPAAVAHTQRAIALYDLERDRDLARAHGGYDPALACRAFGAHALWYLGYPDRGLRQFEEALTFARALDHQPSVVMGFSQIAMHHHLRGEPLAAEKYAETALDLARRHDYKFWLGHAAVSHSWAVAAQGRQQGIDAIRRGIDAYRATGAELEGPIWAAMLADALLRHRRIEEALAVLVDAITKTSTTGVRLHLAELHRLKGAALVKLGGSPEELQASLQRAIDVAHEQCAKSLKLRAATSMARIWRDQGKPLQARELLAPIYGWFTEGFDTLDLKEAKALLEELAQSPSGDVA
jgi:class 3 adenylate cyclase/predicted ATPase